MASDQTFSVLLVCHSYPPVPGGSEVEAQRVASALIARGHRVTVLCSGGEPMPAVARWVDPLGVPVRIFGHKGSRIWRDRVLALAVAWTIFKDRNHYDIVYFLMQGLHVATGLPLARWLSKAIVMKISGSNIITVMRKFRIGRLELRWMRKWCHRVMILNEGMVQEAVDAGFSRDQLLWMPNPVDVVRFAPCDPGARARLRAEAGLGEHSPVALYVGRLAPEKALPSLLEGFKRALREFPDALLVLAGDGPERSKLTSLAARLQITNNIRFLGRLAEKEVVTWLQRADVFALVSEFEGFPCALVEAMAAGLPSVVSRIPGNTQLVEHEKHGLLVKQGSVDSIGGALTRLFADRAWRARMGTAARQLVLDNYSTDRIVSRYEALFASALGAK
jgi:glycosyltransferase involved in cell wall biosynthesis